MKKILFSLMALVASMSMSAQVMKVMKNGVEVAKYKGAEYTVVFEEAPALGKTGTEKRTGNIDVNWVQLWEDGPRFAEYNVGVTDGKAESYGGYYCWGSSIDKDPNGAYNDGNANLTGDDDTATKLWGSAWRMPTETELQVLLEKCVVEWTDNYKETGVEGRVFTGKDDYASNSIFLPAAGKYDYSDGHVSGQGRLGYYWSSTPNGSGYAYYLTFDSDNQNVLNIFRDYGCSVRAVLAE